MFIPRKGGQTGSGTEGRGRQSRFGAGTGRFQFFWRVNGDLITQSVTQLSVISFHPHTLCHSSSLPRPRRHQTQNRCRRRTTHLSIFLLNDISNLENPGPKTTTA
ncbi:hypothetical protein DVH24_002290 [Malus domestica]|uniref:Uncharacterized protein n=1 Tax=Malus domestica TaxID=3750 RepID=A0A498I975_MALDO|nr:hypothetical protein DVH24_002290 [Malus domestica]